MRKPWELRGDFDDQIRFYRRKITCPLTALIPHSCDKLSYDESLHRFLLWNRQLCLGAASLSGSLKYPTF